MKYRDVFKIAIMILCMALVTGCSSEASNSNIEETTRTQSGFTLPGDEVQTAQGYSESTSDGERETFSEGKTEEPISETDRTEPGESETSPSESVTNHSFEKIVCLDPGHGGIYTGANAQGCVEKQMALQVAFGIKAYLENNYQNVTVVMTRETDTQFSANQKTDLVERVKFAADHQADILVSLHFNTDGLDHTHKGALVCVSKQPWIKAQSEDLGGKILNHLAALGIQNGGFLRRDSEEYMDENGNPLDYYSICRNSAARNLVGIIVEHCFMDNPEEYVFFGTEEAINKLAEADALGIAEYLNLQSK